MLLARALNMKVEEKLNMRGEADAQIDCVGIRFVRSLKANHCGLLVVVMKARVSEDK